jgi:uracil-DNA glycosylase
MTLEDRMGSSWYKQLESFILSDEQRKRALRIGERRKQSIVYPSIPDTFRAFRLVPYDGVRCVILGQDPYHDGQANGLAFSTMGKINPSLHRINEGMDDDLAIGDFLDPVKKYDWTYLTAYGVLLLNAALTVEKGRPLSHAVVWEPFMIEVMALLEKHPGPLVFLLWGANAQKIVGATTIPMKHLCIECEHPAFAARQNRPWEHKNCFSATNKYLVDHGQKKIMW